MLQFAHDHGAGTTTQTPTTYQARFLRSEVDLGADFQQAIGSHHAAAQQLRDITNKRAEELANSKQLSTEAKRVTAARTYRAAQATAQAAMDTSLKAINARRQALANKAFGSDKPVTGDNASALRQARAMAADLEDPRQAEDMIRTAQMGGDVVLAKAAAAVAYERGWTKVVDLWGTANQEAIGHLIELAHMPDTSDSIWRINHAAHHAIDKPAILDGLRDWEVDRLVREGDLGGDAA